MNQIGHLVVTPDIAIERPSDQIWFRFETYKLKEGEWGFRLWRANSDAANNLSDPDWRSEAAVIEWLHNNIETWGRVKGHGWCSDAREPPAKLGM